MGRPKAENPKDIKMSLRMDVYENENKIVKGWKRSVK